MTEGSESIQANVKIFSSSNGVSGPQENKAKQRAGVKSRFILHGR